MAPVFKSNDDGSVSLFSGEWGEEERFTPEFLAAADPQFFTFDGQRIICLIPGAEAVYEVVGTEPYGSFGVSVFRARRAT